MARLPAVRRLRAFAALLLVAALLVPVPAAAVDPLTYGKTSGQAFGPGEHDEWKIDIVSGPTWTFDETRQASGTDDGIAWESAVSAQAGFELTTDAAGALTRFHASSSVRASFTNLDDADVYVDIDIPFRATTEVIHVQATFNAAVAPGSGADAYGFAGIVVFCTDPTSPTGMTRIEVRAQAESDAGQPPTSVTDPPVDINLGTASGDCKLSLRSSAETTAGADDEGGRSSASAGYDITITADEGPCVLSGIVSTGVPGVPAAEHAMRGIGVELLDDDQVVARAVSDRDGRYCFRDVDRAEYAIRASLVEAEHEPPIFRTLHFPSTDDVVTEGTVVEDDFGRDDFGLDFRPTDTEPWRAEVAAIHRESMRFVAWLIEAGIASAAELGTFTIQTDSDQGTSYADEGHEIRIQASDTRYDERRNGWSQCPENCEWHEIGHHMEEMLGFAESDSEPCIGREPHAGWANATSCDSFVEGFASFISTYGSLTIDAGREPPYATEYYSVFGSFEANTNLPWQVWVGDNGVIGREDHAVSQLLWDLVDDTPAEEGLVSFFDSANLEDFATLNETIAIEGTPLIRLLEATTPQTVAELRDVLVASDLVPDAQKARTLDVDGNGQPDVSELDAAILIHAFYPVADIAQPFYRVGEPVARTDRQPVDPSTGRPTGTPGPVTENREHIPQTPGAAIRLENPRATEAMFTIAVAYPGLTSKFDVVVGAHASEVVGLELPPYWGTADATAALPACGAKGPRAVVLTVTVAGQPPLDMDSCAYWHAVEAATGASAVTYSSPSDGSATPGPATPGPGTPSPAGDAAPTGVVVVAAVAGVLVLGLVLLFVVFRRRRGQPGTPTG